MHRLRAFLVRLGALGWDHPRAVLFGLACVLLLSIWAIPRLVVDPSIEGLLGHDAAENQATDRVRDLFGTDETAVVVVTADDVLAPTTLARLRDLADDLERDVPHLAYALSLVNAPLTRREGDRVRVEGALRPWPDSAAALAQRIEALDASPLARALLMDEARRTTFVNMTLEPPPGGARVSPPEVVAEVMDSVRAVMARHDAPGWSLVATGKVAIPDALGRTLPRDVLRYALLATLISAGLLWRRFRHLNGVLIPLVVTLPPVLGTLALMAVVGDPLQLPSAVLPPLVLVISVAGVVHVLSDLDHRLVHTPQGRAAMLQTLEDKAEPLALAALTTAVGMASLTMSDLGPAVIVGRYGTFAALVGLLSTVLVVPAWCRTFPWPARADRSEASSPVWGRLAHLASRHPRGILAVSVAALALGLASASQLRFTHDPLTWLPAHWEARRGAEQLDAALHVSVDLEVLIDTGRRDGALDPAVLDQVSALQDAIGHVHHGPTRSVLGHLAALRDTFDGGLPYDTSPAGRRRIKRDFGLLRLTAADAIDTHVTRDGRYLRLTVYTDTGDARTYGDLTARVDALAAEHLEGLDHEVAGMAPVFAATLRTLERGASIAWPVALVGGGLLMLIVARSIPLGLALLLPNTLPAAIALGVLPLIGKPLDMFVLLTVSLAMGIVVDDAIHLVTTFRERLSDGAEAEAAAVQTLQAAGPPIVLTTALLSGGWATLAVSPIPAVQSFGLLSSFTLLVGLVADLIVTPALIVAWTRWRQS